MDTTLLDGCFKRRNLLLVVFSFLYDLGIGAYNALIFVASFFNAKAKLLIQGRRETSKRIKSFRSEHPTENIVWMHCASLGEFEQGKAVLKAIKSNFPKKKVALSFYSPSGYEIVKNEDWIDLVFYLPKDSKRKMTGLLKDLNPSLLVLVKYEFWYQLLKAMRISDLPIVLISGSFRKNQYFFSTWARPVLNEIREIKYFFTIDEKDSKVLKTHQINNVSTVGDTRVQGVIQNLEHVRKYPKIAQHCTNYEKSIIYGSIWIDDLECLLPFIKNHPNYLHLLAPHEVDKHNVERITKQLDKFNTWEDTFDSNLLIVNEIGHLKHLYQYGDLAYIGGGFHDGLHNTLEAAVFNLPLIVGPDFNKFEEVKEFLKVGVAHSVDNPTSFKNSALTFLDDNINLTKEYKAYFDSRKESTRLIIDYLRTVLTPSSKI